MANTGNTKTKSGTTQKQTASVSDMPEISKDPIVARDIDPHQYVTVRNGFQGRLIYKSKRTGEMFAWDEFGSEQEMELKELRDAKNSCKKMFINNWFMFDENWIVDYLGVGQYYKNTIKIEDFDTIFTKSPTEIKKAIGAMSAGQKKSISYRARQLINEGTIDSRKAIDALEEALGIELIER